MSPSPSAARYRFRPGKTSRINAPKPAPAPRANQPLPPPRQGIMPAAKSFCCTGAAEADKPIEGAATATVKLPVTAAVPVTLIAKGFGMQVTPEGRPVAGQVTFTLPVNPPVGVTVIVEVPLTVTPTGGFTG